ncbi:peptidylprolyl isomerase [Candidatus Poribacteria bacterium]|nr:peptidylprolyl isomerase [Candidatus Poribacteria bacterium]
MVISDKTVVSIHYTLKDVDGKLLDSSDESEPFTYLHGTGNIVVGLEKALSGKSAGDQLTVEVSPQEGYGEVDSKEIKTVDKSVFREVDSIQVGMTFNAQSADGSSKSIKVTAIEGDKITIDSNHPLAGITLHFEVQVISIRKATAIEIDHRHAH